MHRSALGPALRRGMTALLLLGALTAVEYAVAVLVKPGAFPFLVVMALAKAGIIAHTFMHIAQLWQEEE